MSKTTKRKRKKSGSSISPSFLVITLLILVGTVVAVSFVACSDNDKPTEESSGAMTQSNVEDKDNSKGTNENSEDSADDNTSFDESYESNSKDNSEDKSDDSDKSDESHVSDESSSSSEYIDEPGGGEEYSHISWFKAENGRRYDAYGAKNPEYTKEQVVTFVNIGLDNPYYTNARPANKADGIFILVNKYSYVDRNYTPDNLVELDSSCKISGKSVKLVKEAADAFKKLSEDAAALEYCILGMSGYRTYAYQENLYNKYLKNDTQENVDTYSARPGYSEHHTGLALDVQTDKVSFSNFGQTKEFEWLLDNAHKYGFVIHYTTENQHITGYMPEEWHIRYVGIPAASYMYDNNLSVDEYLVMYGADGPQAVG